MSRLALFFCACFCSVSAAFCYSGECNPQYNLSGRSALRSSRTVCSDELLRAEYELNKNIIDCSAFNGIDPQLFVTIFILLDGDSSSKDTYYSNKID